eukprot:430282-Prorocentrum_minimum.AAC.2
MRPSPAGKLDSPPVCSHLTTEALDSPPVDAAAPMVDFMGPTGREEQGEVCRGAQILDLLDPKDAGEIIANANVEYVGPILNQMSDAAVQQILTAMSPNRAAKALDSLAAEKVRDVMCDEHCHGALPNLT